MRFTFRLQVQHNDPLGDYWAALKPFEWWDLICFMERVVLVIKFVYAGQLLRTMLINVDFHFFLHSFHFPALAHRLGSGNRDIWSTFSGRQHASLLRETS